MKKFISAFAILTLLFSLTACSSSNSDADSTNAQDEVENSSNSDSYEYTIGLSMNSFDSYQTGWYQQFVDQANSLGMEVIVTNSENSVDKQISDVEGLVGQGVDLLAVCCVDGAALASTIDEATTAGIPVYCPQFETTSENMICCPGLGLDQAQNGVLQCQALENWLEEHPGKELKCGYLQGAMTIWSAAARYEGFADNLPEGAELIVADTANWSADEAMALVEDWLVAYPDLNCIVAANDEMALAAVNVLKSNGITDFSEFPILGVDVTEDGETAIAAGEMLASVYRDWQAEARMCADVGYAILQGQTFEGDKYVPTYTPDGTFVLVTQDNVDTYEENSNVATPSVQDFIDGNY